MDLNCWLANRIHVVNYKNEKLSLTALDPIMMIRQICEAPYRNYKVSQAE